MTVSNLPNRAWLLALLFMPLTAVANPAAGVPDPTDPTLGIPVALEFGASLLLVITAIFIVGWFYARMQGIRGGRSNVFNIVASQSMGAKERIILVEVGEKQIVVGITAASMQALHVFDQPVEVANAQPGKSEFAERLSSVFRGAAK